MKKILLQVVLVFVTGCKVGPDYRAPDPSMPRQYVDAQAHTTFSPTGEDLAEWWKIFNDPFLDSLLAEAVSASFDYRTALENVHAARAQYRIDYAKTLPEFEFDAQASRFRTSKAFRSEKRPPLKSHSTTKNPPTKTAVTFPFGTFMGTTAGSTSKTTTRTKPPRAPRATQNFFQLGFDMLWELDLFGKLGRVKDASYDLFEAMEATSRDVKITVLSEVARTYVLICSYQRQVALAKKLVEDDETLFSLTLNRFYSGLRNEQEVERARASYGQSKASLQSLLTQLKQAIFSLSILLGKTPETIIERFAIERPIPIARGKVPLGVPADLLKRRHDIRAAERELAAATEQVGVAIAEKYPSISLTGSSASFAANPLRGANIGFASDKADTLLKKSARIWGIGALFSVPVFDFGKRNAAVKVQMALQRQAEIAFQKTVIAALQEVEDAYAAFFNEEEREQNLSTAESAEKKKYDLVAQLFATGLIERDQLLDAQKTWIQSVSTHTTSQQALTQNLIALYKSLGGDW